MFAEDESIDEAVEVILELGGLVGTVDDPPIIGRIGVRLSTKLKAKVFNHICIQRQGQSQGPGVE